MRKRTTHPDRVVAAVVLTLVTGAAGAAVLSDDPARPAYHRSVASASASDGPDVVVSRRLRRQMRRDSRLVRREARRHLLDLPDR